MSRETILAKVESLPSSPKVIEALWDGDSDGWFIRFSAISEDGQSHWLGALSEGGDIRLFNGQVPPWPEALAAQHLGDELAHRYGAHFYFPSPEYHEDDCPSWNDREQGYPCSQCGIPLLQREPCPWRGLCYHCHLDKEREEREASWTQEKREGPRCHICGNPASGELNGGLACRECLDKYEVYQCERCQCRVMTSQRDHSSLCSGCELQIQIDALTEVQRDTIREAMAKGRFEGLRSAIDVMGCSLNEAQSVLHLLRKSNG